MDFSGTQTIDAPIKHVWSYLLNVHNVAVCAPGFQSLEELGGGINSSLRCRHVLLEDKYALVENWMREKFQRMLAHRLPASSTLQQSTLHTLILAVFDSLAFARRYARPSNRQFFPLFERAIQQELSAILLRWLQQTPAKLPPSEETLETMAQVMSWAIFGPAAQWSREERNCSAEEMAQRVLTKN